MGAPAYASVGLRGDDGEAAAPLDGSEQERPGAGETEAVLAADGFAGLLADDLLGGVTFVEGARRDEVASLCHGLCPHAPSAAPELLEASFENGVGLTVEGGGYQLELGDSEIAGGIRNVGEDAGAWVCAMNWTRALDE